MKKIFVILALLIIVTLACGNGSGSSSSSSCPEGAQVMDSTATVWLTPDPDDGRKVGTLQAGQWVNVIGCQGGYAHILGGGLEGWFLKSIVD